MRGRKTGFLRCSRLRQIKAGRPVCSRMISVPSGSLSGWGSSGYEARTPEAK
jgi:hypothetical protein